jgi:hypothetical protein
MIDQETLPLHYEASLFPVENRSVGQESDIWGYFLRSESTRNGNPRNGTSVPSGNDAGAPTGVSSLNPFPSQRSRNEPVYNNQPDFRIKEAQSYAVNSPRQKGA